MIVVVTIATGCSTQKNTWATRSFHQTKVKYNILYNGNTAYEEGLKQIRDAHEDDYSRILYLYPVSNHTAAEAAEKAAQAPEKPEGCALIGIEDFMGVELRTAKILECEKVPKAKKLLKLQVDLGYEQRQVVSGIAKFYEPEALIGKKIILVTNLRPAVLCGIESNGMILASGEETVRVVFLAEDTPLGERVR